MKNEHHSHHGRWQHKRIGQRCCHHKRRVLPSAKKHHGETEEGGILKNGKKPTVRQCELMKQWRLDPSAWLVVKDTSEEMVIVHRHSDKTTKTIPKGNTYEEE